MALTNFPNGLSSFGMPVIPGLPLPFTGNVFFVKPYTGNDGNDGKTPTSALKTLTTALAKCVTNHNDVVFLVGESNTAAYTTNLLSANLDWNLDSTHLIGINCGGNLSSRSRIAPLATATIFADMFTLSGNNCLIANIEFIQEAMLTSAVAAMTCVKVTGMRNHFVNCQISGMASATLDYAGSNSLTISGAENQFDDCYIGLDTIIRATSVTEVILSGSCPRNIFRHCHFETYTSSTSFKMITVPTSCDRFVKFVDCIFHAVQHITSAVSPSGVIGITTMNGEVLMMNPYVYGFDQIVTADNSYVQVLGLNGTATGHLIGIAQGVDAT